LNEALVLKSIQIAEFNQKKGRKGAVYRKMLPNVLKGHTPVFTHGDFQRKNIIVSLHNLTYSGNKQSETEEAHITWSLSIGSKPGGILPIGSIALYLGHFVSTMTGLNRSYLDISLIS
jgi:hypothetical protein